MKSGSGNFVPVLPILRPLLEPERNWVVQKERRGALRQYKRDHGTGAVAERAWTLHWQKIQSKAIRHFFYGPRTTGVQWSHPSLWFDEDDEGEPDPEGTTFGFRIARTEEMSKSKPENPLKKPKEVGSVRVYRGGSWNRTKRVAVAGNRYSILFADERDSNLGFRIARTKK